MRPTEYQPAAPGGAGRSRRPPYIAAGGVRLLAQRHRGAAHRNRHDAVYPSPPPLSCSLGRPPPTVNARTQRRNRPPPAFCPEISVLSENIPPVRNFGSRADCCGPRKQRKAAKCGCRAPHPSRDPGCTGGAAWPEAVAGRPASHAGRPGNQVGPPPGPRREAGARARRQRGRGAHSVELLGLVGGYDPARASIHCLRCRPQLPCPVRNVSQPQAAAAWRSSWKLNGSTRAATSAAPKVARVRPPDQPR